MTIQIFLLKCERKNLGNMETDGEDEKKKTPTEANVLASSTSACTAICN